MRRVLKVIPSCEVGGAERYVARVAPLLAKHGVQVEVCALDRRGPLAGALEAAGVRVHGTRYAERSRSSYSRTLARTVADIRRLVRAGRFDIVHTYLFWTDVLGSLGARLAGCPRVIVSRRALHPWRHRPSPLFHGLELGANLCAHELIANSQAVLRDVEASERFLPRRRTVIYNGVDPAAYPAARPARSGGLRLLTVGALDHRKGQEYALRALRQLLDGGLDARLTLVGRGADEEMLRSLARELKLARAVVFAGEQEPEAYLADSDLFVLPSRQEGFSNALLEAMASSLPCVATDAGGNPEALVDGEGGRIVPREDPAALAAAIRELAGDRPRMRRMGTANRRRVEEHFSLERSAACLAAWYLGRPA